jgi:hypothetical protein
VKPEDLELLKKHYPDFPRDFDQSLLPKLPESLSKLLGEMNQADLQKQFESVNLDELKKQLEQVRGQNSVSPSSTGSGSSSDERARTEPRPPALPKESDKGPKPTPATNPDGSPHVVVNAPESADLKSPFTERLLELAERFKKLDPSLQESPALNRAIQELSRYAGGQDERWQKMSATARGVGDRFAQWNQNLHLERLVPEKGFRWPRASSPRSLPHIPWPDVSAPPSNRGRIGMPRMDRPSAPDKAGWPMILGAVAVILPGVLVWLRWARRSGAGAHAGSAGERLGPWPLNPRTVSTPEELIRAFEYFSVLTLGPAARNWNHRTIAAFLRQDNRAAGRNAQPPAHDDLNGQRRRAADQLADLYERARYAPPDDPLSQAALATAKQNLCLLAGVNAA